MNKDNDLTKGSLMKHIKNIAIPASLGYLFNTMFNVVDTFYAGKISTEALAGLTVSFPIFFIIISLSVGLGRGTTALFSNALGEKKEETLEKIGFNGLVLGLFLGGVMIVFGPIITPFLFDLTGATGQAKVLGVDYTTRIFWGSAFFTINYVFNGILNAQGDARSFRNFLIIGFFLNLVLDPLFIFGWFNLPQFGTVGIAFATIFVQFIGSIYLFYKAINSEKFNLSAISVKNFDIKVILRILEQSIPAALNMATIALGVYVINFFILKYAGDTVIAGYGVGVRIEQLVLLPALGINIAVLSIVGQNFGARNYNRVKDISQLSKKISVIMMIIGGVLIFPTAELLISIFNSDQNVVIAGGRYLRIEVFALPAYVLINIVIAAMQGLKKPYIAVYVGIYRQILMPMIVFYILGTTLNLGVLGIYYGIVIINWSAAFILLIYEKRTFSRIKRIREEKSEKINTSS